MAAIYFAGSALWQGRDLGPHAHDEFMYLLQARQLASGRLWSAASPLADFFDSPYLIVRPVYAAKSWPGTALFYVPGVLVGLPVWVTAALLSGGVVGVFFHLCAMLFDGIAPAVVGAILLAANRPLHTISVTANAHIPVLLTGFCAVVAAVGWATGGGWRAAVVFGMAAGWAVITRPVDAICLVAPAALIAAFYGNGSRFKAFLIAILAAGPFLALQLVFDKGVTGRWLDPPFSFYDRRDYPQVSYGFPAYDPAAHLAVAGSAKAGSLHTIRRAVRSQASIRAVARRLGAYPRARRLRRRAAGPAASVASSTRCGLGLATPLGTCGRSNAAGIYHSLRAVHDLPVDVRRPMRASRHAAGPGRGSRHLPERGSRLLHVPRL